MLKKNLTITDEELAAECPREVWAVVVVIGDKICWPLFTQHKDFAEQIASHHDAMIGINSMAVAHSFRKLMSLNSTSPRMYGIALSCGFSL